MKKLLAVLLCLAMIFSLAACGTSGSGSDKPGGSESSQSGDSGNSSSQSRDAGSSGQEQAELKEPELAWWYIKTNTGIPTLIMEIKNGNDVDIDLELDVEYIKGGEVIHKDEDLYCNCIPAGQSMALFNTWEVPEAADSIRLNCTYLEESVYKPVELKIADAVNADGYLDLGIEAEAGYYDGSVTVVFFSGDIPVSLGVYAMMGEGSENWTCEVLEHYDSYRIYPNAYVY